MNCAFDKLNKASIFILDEFGYVPYDKDGINILFDFLSEISDDPTKVVILNTNLEFPRWVNVLYDQKMTAALIGRLTHYCHLILFPGENNRLKRLTGLRKNPVIPLILEITGFSFTVINFLTLNRFCRRTECPGQALAFIQFSAGFLAQLVFCNKT
jgi:hypothetical protein